MIHPDAPPRPDWVRLILTALFVLPVVWALICGGLVIGGK